MGVGGGGCCPLSAHSISGGGGGGAVPFWRIPSVGGGGGGCCPLSAHSISGVGGGGGACMLTFITRVPLSPKGGGGGGRGHGPPHPLAAGLAYLVCALQVLCKPCLWC